MHILQYFTDLFKYYTHCIYVIYLFRLWKYFDLCDNFLWTNYVL